MFKCRACRSEHVVRGPSAVLFAEMPQGLMFPGDFADGQGSLRGWEPARGTTEEDLDCEIMECF